MPHNYLRNQKNYSLFNLSNSFLIARAVDSFKIIPDPSLQPRELAKLVEVAENTNECTFSGSNEDDELIISTIQAIYSIEKAMK